MDLFFWELARASGLATHEARCTAGTTGLAPRPQVLGFLAQTRALRALHDWTPWIIIPAAIAHVVALLLDATAQISLLDVVVPFQTSYGQLAIGLGTISLDLPLIVLVTTWMPRSMSNGAWQLFHRLSYVGCVRMFLHAVLSGTDLASPAISVMTWATALAIAYYSLERAGKGLGMVKARA